MTHTPPDVKSVFGRALEIESLSARAAYLDQACGKDAGLRSEVEGLLATLDRADEFMRRPAAADVEGLTSRYEPLIERPGSEIGPYKLMEQIGEGGMGLVFVAEQQHPVRRKVALKIIKPGTESQQVIARFEAERQALAVMDHQNIARVLDAGTTASGRPFFVMELVHGVPITTYCDANQLTTRRRLELVVPVCLAIQHAHQKGIIHRDIKPSNVLVTMCDDKPVPKIIDFGVAKAIEQRLTEKTVYTQFGTLVGTFEYMSPEQAEMNTFGVDTRSDIYSLGVLLYELLTGTTPLERPRLRAAAFGEIVRLIKEEEPQWPSVRLSTSGALTKVAAARKTDPARLSRMVKGELDWVVMKCLEKQRTRRYDSASGLARDLERYLADEVVEARSPSAAYRLKKFVRRHKSQVIAASLILFALVAGIVGTTWGLIRAAKASAELAVKNTELAAEQFKVQARLDMAVKAIERFHAGVSEDMLLKNAEFKELRTKLLKDAARFYADLEKLLAGQTDAKSQKTLAAAYFQLGELTSKIGDQKEALALHRKGLSLRRELAAAKGTDLEARLGLARSMRALSLVLYHTGDPSGAQKMCEEQRDNAAALEAESATDDVLAVVAQSHFGIGAVLFRAGKHEEAMQAYKKSIAIWQKLADANPTVANYHSDLAHSYNESGLLLLHKGKPEEALMACRSAFAIQQKLADANPAVMRLQYALANIHDYIGWCLLNMGNPVEGVEADRNASDIMQKLVDDNPTITLFQDKLANFQINIGRGLDRQKRSAEAFTALEKGLDIVQKLVKANPNNNFQRELGEGHAFRGGARVRAGQPADAAADLRLALELWAKLPNLDIEIRVERARALALLAGLGGDAKSGVTTIEARTFADQSVAALSAVVETGWALPSELKEPDFDALRSRTDFQKVFSAVEAATGKPSPQEK